MFAVQSVQHVGAQRNTLLFCWEPATPIGIDPAHLITSFGKRFHPYGIEFENLVNVKKKVGRSGNPITTGGEQIMPTNFFLPSGING